MKFTARHSHERSDDANCEACNDARDYLGIAAEQCLSTVIVAPNENNSHHDQQASNSAIEGLRGKLCRPACTDPRANEAAGQQITIVTQ